MRRPNAVQTLALGFALLILAGACLLSLPIASRSGEAIPWTNAVFTAASASCVTGLTVYDTATQFSAFGQVVLLLLIQIGGLGFVTASLRCCWPGGGWACGSGRCSGTAWGPCNWGALSAWGGGPCW